VETQEILPGRGWFKAVPGVPYWKDFGIRGQKYGFPWRLLFDWILGIKRTLGKELGGFFKARFGQFPTFEDWGPILGIGKRYSIGGNLFLL